jgi:hypothetical protein
MAVLEKALAVDGYPVSQLVDRSYFLNDLPVLHKEPLGRRTIIPDPPGFHLN